MRSPPDARRTPPPPPPAAQERSRHWRATARWAAWLRSDIGLQRPRQEDAWQVLAAVPMAGAAWDAFAVFDGLGGEPHGREAAWAAAGGLEGAMRRAAGPQDVLRLLDADVTATGGAATAMLALQPCARPGETWFLAAGDSSAYALVDGAVVPLVERDRAGRHAVTDCLGHPLRGGRAVRWQPGRPERFLLCTDGVDDVAGLDALRPCLEAPAGSAKAAMDTLFADIRRKGAPDNATALLVHPLAPWAGPAKAGAP